ncbi:MAG: PIG-L deacetylase family protein [Patescibacteria group bacterium]
MSTIVGVFAHPDDEAFGPGGTIAKLAKTNDVHLICVTDGNHGEKGLKSIRNQELISSAKILGVKNVIFFDFADGELSNNSYHSLESQLKTELDKLTPKTVITFHPNGVSGHIDHMVVTSVIDHLFPKLNYLKKIMYYAMRDLERKEIGDYFVHMPAGLSKDQADEVVDVSQEWLQFVNAVRAHKSQSSDADWVLGIAEKLPKEEYFIVRSK